MLPEWAWRLSYLGSFFPPPVLLRYIRNTVKCPNLKWIINFYICNIPITPDGFPCPFLVHLPLPKANTILTSSTIVFTALELYINGILHYGLWCLFSFVAHYLVRFIHVLQISSLFFLVAMHYSTVYPIYLFLWAVSNILLLWMKLLWTFLYMCFGGHVPSLPMCTPST